MKKAAFIIFSFILLFGCEKIKNNDNNCDGIDCLASPQVFNFEIINTESGENLITSGTFNLNQISISDLKTGNLVEFKLLNENNSDLIQLDMIVGDAENMQYLINIGDIVGFKLSIETEQSIEDCCPVTTITNFEIKNIEYETDSVNGIYKILVANNLISTTKFSYSLFYEYGDQELIYSKEYRIDTENKVVSEKYTWSDNSAFNHLSIFKYNSEGKLISEIRQGEIYQSIVWENDLATAYSAKNQKYAEFLFDNGLIKEFTINYPNNELFIRKFNFNEEGNIISKENNHGLFSEYFEYNLSKANPYQKLLSIGILNPSREIWSANIFEVQKIYDEGGDDYLPSIHSYNYYYEFDEQGRVIKERNDLSAIYIVEFNYE